MWSAAPRWMCTQRGRIGMWSGIALRRSVQATTSDIGKLLNPPTQSFARLLLYSPLCEAGIAPLPTPVLVHSRGFYFSGDTVAILLNRVLLKL